MLAKNTAFPGPAKFGARQGGVVLLIALIVLVAMTLAGIALVRSVDTINIIAGNLAFRQAATLSGDTGVEAAIVWLEDCVNDRNGCLSTTLNNDIASRGYAANGSVASNGPGVGESWDAYYIRALLNRREVVLPTDANTNNTVRYAIDRLCALPGPPSGGASCSASPLVTTVTGNEEEAGQIQLNAPSQVYYRITVRIEGPRNTVSYIQTVVAL